MARVSRTDKDKAYLDDIRESCGLILDYVKDKHLPDFVSDHLLQDAVGRRLAIIGEAAKSLSDEAKVKYPDVKWKDMGRLRDLMIHHYWSLDLATLWEITQTDVPDLLAILLA